MAGMMTMMIGFKENRIKSLGVVGATGNLPMLIPLTNGR
jgi:hypothetical protein